jgi:Immunity protein 26
MAVKMSWENGNKRKNRNKILPGDIFAFVFNEAAGGNQYGFGRIVSRIFTGHVAEIFNYFSAQPTIDLSQSKQRFKNPVILDAYSLFQLRREGDWRFIGTTENYQPDADLLNVRFAWGTKGDQRATDLQGNWAHISDAEADSLPRENPYGDWDVKNFIENNLDKKIQTIQV